LKVALNTITGVKHNNTNPKATTPKLDNIYQFSEEPKNTNTVLSVKNENYKKKREKKPNTLLFSIT